MNTTAKHVYKLDKHYFDGKREQVIKRDKYRCCHCGMTRLEHKRKYGKDITVDHIDGNGSKTPKHKKNNEMSNLQTLCLSCHAKKDIKRHGHFGANETSFSKEYNPSYLIRGKRFKIVDHKRVFEN